MRRAEASDDVAGDADGERWSARSADLAYILAGVLISGFALKGFILTNGFLDGGTTGLSLTLNASFGVDVGLLVLPLNLPFLLWGIRLVGAGFAARTLGAILALSVCLLVIHYPTVTTNKLLVAIFGGSLMGLGVGLAIRGGAALDGLDIAVLYTGRKLPFTTNELILALNAAIFLAAAAQFGAERALYSMLIYFCGSRASSFVVDGLEEYTGVTIVSADPEAVRRVLVLDLGRGITVYKGERGFLPGSFAISAATEIVFAVVTRLEVRRLSRAVHAIDPTAFIVISAAKEASGGVLRRRRAIA